LVEGAAVGVAANTGAASRAVKTRAERAFIMVCGLGVGGLRQAQNARILQCRMNSTPDAKTALAWTHTARVLTTASQLDQLPVHELPEIAFVGRSNAGKSTAINCLAQQKRLAFASKTPGRTQHINLFALGPKDAPNAYFLTCRVTAMRPLSERPSCAGSR
jgi:hypothetical protein